MKMIHFVPTLHCHIIGLLIHHVTIPRSTVRDVMKENEEDGKKEEMEEKKI